MNQLLYADDTVLFRNFRENLQRLLNEFDNECKRRKLKVNLGKSQGMVCRRAERGEHLDLSLNGEILEEVDSSKHLGSVERKNGGVVDDMISRVNEGAKVFGALSRIWKVGSFGMGIKRMTYERE